MVMADDVRPNIKDAVTRLNNVSGQLASTTARLDRLMASSEGPVTHFTEQGLFEMERLLRDARSAATEFRELSRSLKETPSQLMFERPESGVEINREGRRRYRMSLLTMLASIALPQRLRQRDPRKQGR